MLVLYGKYSTQELSQDKYSTWLHLVLYLSLDNSLMLYFQHSTHGNALPFTYIYIYVYIYQDSPVVSHRAKKKQHARAGYVTTGVLFTATNAVKFASAVTRSSWVLSLSCYRANTFLSCRTSKLKMTEFNATVVKNQQFWLLWHPFPRLRLKLGCF